MTIVGKKYNRLTVIAVSGWVGGGKNPSRYYECVCDCGTTKRVAYTNLSSGATKSCGCINTEKETNGTKHGHWLGGKASPTLTAYKDMVGRCSKSSRPDYVRYGGSGVKVDSRWLGKDGFANFLIDMGKRPNNTVLGRNNANDDFSKDSCRWMTARERWSVDSLITNNKYSEVEGILMNKKTGKWMVYVKFNGVTKCLGGFTEFEKAVERRKLAAELVD